MLPRGRVRPAAPTHWQPGRSFYPMPATLAHRLAARDSRRFAGRRHELRLADELFAADPAASVLFLHGAPGLGKSAVLREIARRAEAAGLTPVLVDGRGITGLDDLAAALAPARTEARPLVLLDAYEAIDHLGAGLRERVLPTLPARTVIVIAGTRAPETCWRTSGWDALLRVAELAPLPEADALALLAARGLTGADAERIVAGAGGSPLALHRAADELEHGATGGQVLALPLPARAAAPAAIG